MVDSKKNYKFDLGVKGLKTISWKEFQIQEDEEAQSKR